MCGIFALIESESDPSDAFKLGSKRGPEMSKMIKINNNYLGFHRLAINGLNDESNQPLYYKDYVLVCNGEIYNYTELIRDHELEVKTQSDCEVIVAMYSKYGIKCLEYLDGEFVFVLYDLAKCEFFIARDPYGIRPLYIANIKNKYCFASDLEPMLKSIVPWSIEQFKPGTYMLINTTVTRNSYTIQTPCDEKYYENGLYDYFRLAVYKRVSNTERPIACLLSGGLDSSLVAALAARYSREKGQVLETYSIGLPDSEDLKYASKVAEHIKSKHTTIICSEEEFFKAIPNVIKDIGSYDTTTVRASVGNWLIGKYIKEHSQAKVILNGDGADELMGGYMYFHACPTSYEFDKECKRLLSNIQHFDVLRSDKSISSHGLEGRTPYLDVHLVNYYLSIPIELRNHTLSRKIEKSFMRNTIDKLDPTLLPKEILFRKKEAFSDGVSGLNRSWYQIIQERLEQETDQTELDNIYYYNPPITKEQKYYRRIFDNYYPNCDHLIPYYWMPKYVSATDASARTLKLYSLDVV
jgi:asparagine synthase (glutamine-hydrolysing)